MPTVFGSGLTQPSHNTHTHTHTQQFAKNIILENILLKMYNLFTNGHQNILFHKIQTDYITKERIEKNREKK